MPLKLIRRKGSPYWWISGSIRGCRIRESTETTVRRLAAEACSAREAQVHREAIHGTPATRFTFGEVVVAYLEHGAKEGTHSPNTKAKVKRLLTFLGPGMPADAVDQAELDRACSKLLRANPSRATRVREIISPARAVLSFGAKRKMCSRPMLDTLRSKALVPDWATPEEVDRLVAAAAPHLQPLLIFLAGTGARLGEALKLQWADVDLKHARAVLRKTKNGSDRPIELCPRVLAALRFDPREKQRRGAARLLVGHVFLTRAGRPYAERSAQGGGQIKTGWKAACTRAGLKTHVTPHGMRHSWASWHYALHKDPLLLKREAGWSSVLLVERYAHLAPASLTEEIIAWRAWEQVMAAAPATPALKPEAGKAV